MTDLIFEEFQIKNYRSLLDVRIKISDQIPIIICGENNIGKTNFLRALNLYFNYPLENELFDPKLDIPEHIYLGSRGAGAKTELTGKFSSANKSISLKIIIKSNEDSEYKLNGKTISQDEAFEFLNEYQFLLIESHNVNLPALISAMLERDGLLKLDKQRINQTEPLEKLQEFINLSQKAISKIEKELNDCFSQLTDFDGILKDKKLKINFAEFETLRDIVKTMTSITLFDGNNQGIASKGSGAQRAVFLALMQYISNNSKRKIIWGIDEPEAFLQPKLQKKVAGVIREIVREKCQPVILTTHSPHFIDLNNLSNTHLFIGTLQERTYQRRPGKVFYETNTKPAETFSDIEKANLIKEHLGISNNDGWQVLPRNIIVEGESDKKYLETIFNVYGVNPPNIIWSGGASKIGGYLEFYNLTSKELGFRPEFICIFDNDEEGRDQNKKIKPDSFKNIKLTKIDLPRFDGLKASNSSKANWEIEDLMPQDKMVDVLNKILRKDKYKPITKKQVTNRFLNAHISKQFFDYAQECVDQNNADKSSFPLNEARKKQICVMFCEEFMNEPAKLELTKVHKDFLESLL